MTPDSTTLYLLYQKEHAVRIAEAQRYRHAHQSAAAHTRHPVAQAIGLRVGIVLVLVGQRLQGAPRGVAAAPAGSIRPIR